MRGRPYFSLAIVVVALLILAPTASATHVPCGATITVDTTLDSNVQCTGINDSGLVIGAPAQDHGVILKLAGHTITGNGGAYGIFASNPSGAKIKGGGGSISGFQYGVAFLGTATGNTVVKTNISSQLEFPGGGLYIAGGSNNLIDKNTITITREKGIEVTGANNRVWRNTVTGAEIGISVTSQGADEVVANQVNDCFGDGTGISVRNMSPSPQTKIEVSRNVVSDCGQRGVTVFRPSSGGGQARPFVRLNQVTGGVVFGLEIFDPGAIVDRNTVTNASHTGIRSTQAGTTIQNNIANNNQTYGIDAAAGTIDGGGNVASGNGNGSTPQCVNVQCSSP